MLNSAPPATAETVQHQPNRKSQVKEQPWKQWIGENTDQGVEDENPDIVHIKADGAQSINLGG
jgi:hypothetical protein